MVDISGTADKVAFGLGFSNYNIVVAFDGNNVLFAEINDTNTDVLTVRGQFSGNTIEKFELSSGLFLDNNQLNTLLSDYTSYAALTGVDISDLNAVKGDLTLMALTSAAFQA